MCSVNDLSKLEHARVPVTHRSSGAAIRRQALGHHSQVQQGAALRVLRLDIQLSLLADKRGRRGVIVGAVREDVVEVGHRSSGTVHFLGVGAPSWRWGALPAASCIRAQEIGRFISIAECTLPYA